MTEAFFEAADVTLVIPTRSTSAASNMTLPTMLKGLRTDVPPLHEVSDPRHPGSIVHPADDVGQSDYTPCGMAHARADALVVGWDVPPGNPEPPTASPTASVPGRHSRRTH